MAAAARDRDLSEPTADNVTVESSTTSNKGGAAHNDAKPEEPATEQSQVSEVEVPPRKSVTVPPSELPLRFPMGPATQGEHCFSHLDATTFSVRGRNYIEDRVKVGVVVALCPHVVCLVQRVTRMPGAQIPSLASVADLVHIDLFKSAEKVDCMAAHPDGYVQKAIAAGDTRFFICVTFQVRYCLGAAWASLVYCV